MNDPIESTVVSSRIRLARNFADYPFSSRLKNISHAKEMIRRLGESLNYVDDFRVIYMDEISSSEANNLKENYLISQALIDNKEYSAVYINRDEDVSIMVNEEDHVREQFVTKGLSLWKAYEYLSGIDDRISETIRFSFDEEFGYLTACPSNLGTGLRASVMMFLPAITKNGNLKELQSVMNRLGLTIRGVYGEGSLAEGDLYQISNEVTLGLSEKDILNAVEEAVIKLAELEIRTRNQLYAENPIQIKDTCGRAYGILMNCARIGAKEFTRCIADLKFGVALGLYDGDLIQLEDLSIAMRSSNIDRFSKEELTDFQRDIYRAEYSQKRLKEIMGN